MANHKTIKMKKFICTLIFLLPLALVGQNQFTGIEITVNPGQQGSVADLIELHYGDANFKTGSGLNLERLWQGSGDKTHRIVFYGPLGNSGRVDGDVKPFQNTAFWASLNYYTSGSGSAYSGRVLDYKEGNEEQDHFILYDVIIKDMASYMKAHEQITKDMSNGSMGERTFAVGTYDIGRPNNATHWIALSGSSNDDLIKMHNDFQTTYIDAVTKYFMNRGEVIELKDMRVENLKSYN